MQNRQPAPYDRKVNDDDWDEALPCEKGPDCHDPLCPTKLNRDAMRLALGTLVEGLEMIATVQAQALDYWGACPAPSCTFEAQMQVHLTKAGKALGTAFVHLLDGVEMWKALPEEWTAPEREATLQAIRILKALNLEAQRQTSARKAGSPDPRNPDLTPRAN
jgi:hypothetical protein